MIGEEIFGLQNIEVTITSRMCCYDAHVCLLVMDKIIYNSSRCIDLFELYHI